MAKYQVNFVGSCDFKAESYEEAHQKFWDLISEDKPLPSNLYEIMSIGLIVEEEEPPNEDIDLDCGFDPYMGEYTWDC